MVDITLLKVEVDGNPQLSPSWLSGDEGRSRSDGGTAVEVEDADDGGSGSKVLIGLVALVLTAAVVRKVRGGDDEEEFDAEPEYTVEEPA